MKKRIKQFLKPLIKNLQVLLLFMKLLIRPLRSEKTIAFVFNISKWKRGYIKPYLDDYEVHFMPLGKPFILLKFILKRVSNKVLINWGYIEDPQLVYIAKEVHAPIYRLEDGFIRSKGLGAMHTPPFSMCLDKQGMYFDSTKRSDLEDILNEYDFRRDRHLIERSAAIIDDLLKLGVSKYNHVAEKDISDVYGTKQKYRVLVIGQVEDDASIQKGSNKAWTNNDLVRFAVKEHPDADVIYKPHPDVIAGRRMRKSDPKDIAHLARVIEQPLSINDAFKTIDHVYTITSLTGFEALLRGIKVTTLGAPFYSGWGLTDDRQDTPRRNKSLTIEELFAGAYILYPTYINPYTKEKITIEEAMDNIVSR